MDEVASIRARHREAKPKPTINPAWFHAEQDIARLLIAYDALAARLAEAERDAKRYRWLWRRVDTAPTHGLYPWRNGFDMDAAIDAAMGTADSASVQHEPDPVYGSEAWYFRELMATMHGDGGHYHAQHGAKKAYEDACAKYYRLVSATETAEVRPWHTANCGINQDEPCDCGGGASLTVSEVPK